MKSRTAGRLRKSCWALLACTSVVGPVQAGGFALIEQGASGLGNAYAGASAASHDASTVWWNPAGMLELDRPQLALAGHVIGVTSDFTNRGTTLNPTVGLGDVAGVGELDVGGATLLPNFYYVRGINENLSFGFGISTPFGSSTEFGKDWVGRYQAANSSVQLFDINPSIAWRVNPQLSIGAGVSVQLFDITLGNSVDSSVTCLGLSGSSTNSVQLADCANAGLATAGDRSTDGYAEITGDSVAGTFNLGALYKLSDQTRLGVAYRHGVDHELEGDAEFTTNSNLANILANAQVPLLTDTTITATANLPASVMLSFAHQANEQIELLADATWTRWSSLQELRVKFANPVQPDTFNTTGFDDVWRVSAGVNVKQSDRLTFRAGLAYDQDPVPSVQLRTPRLPGNDRTWIAVGLGYKVDSRMNFDVGFAHLIVDDTPIDNTSESAGGTTIRGVFKAHANILSAQFNYQFN